MGLTVRKLESLKPGKWVSHDGGKGEGRLAARCLKDGRVNFYFRYTKPDGKRDALSLGLFSARKAHGRLTLEQALKQTDVLSKRYRNGDRDLRAALETEARELAAARKEQAKIAAAEAQSATLGDVLEAYCDQLDAQGKASARLVRGTIYRHVRDTWPKTWELKAKDLDIDDLLPLLTKLCDAGKLREAAKLRAYIRSSFTAAIQARQRPGSIAALRELNIRNNPAIDIAPIEQASEGGQRNLTQSELQHYWSRIQNLNTPGGALLRFHLLTGGQRVAQLARLTAEQYDSNAQIITIMDPKGRRKKARTHAVPLMQEAAEALIAMKGGAAGPYLFTTNAGRTGANYDITRKHLAAVCEAMINAEELEHGPFTLGDIRRTVETRLAAAGVAPHIRAQLQSHGISGVQVKHYDRHDYMPEKRKALDTLYRIITQQPGNVIEATFR